VNQVRKSIIFLTQTDTIPFVSSICLFLAFFGTVIDFFASRANS